MVFLAGRLGTRNYLEQAALNLMPGALYPESHWSNSQWLALVRKAYRTVDTAKRNQLVAEAMTIDYEQGGNIIWGFLDTLDGYSSKLGGLTADVASYGGSALGGRYNLVCFV